MHYDLVFLRRTYDQSWDDALAARSQGPAETPLTTHETDAWERLLPEAHALLPGATDSSAPQERRLTHEPTGIELTLRSGEALISVPYRSTGEAALQVMEQVYALARAVEQTTGLVGYDLQLDEPVTDVAKGVVREARAVAEVEREDAAGRPGAGRRVSDSGIDERDDAPQHAPPPPSTSGRRWWEFWRR